MESDEILRTPDFGSMQPAETFVIGEDGSRQAALRIPLRTEFKLDPTTGNAVSMRQHEGEDFRPIPLSD